MDKQPPARTAPHFAALQLTDNFPVGAYVYYRDPHDNGHRFSFFSNRLLEMLAITREELEADPLVAYRPIHPDDQGPFFVQAEEAARLGIAFNVEARYIIRGELRWYRLESSPRQLESGQIVWDGAVIDITQRRQAEDALKEAWAKECRLEEERREQLSQKLKTSLTAAAIVHEIRQPLSSILLNCRLAVQSLEQAASGSIPDPLQRSLLQLTTDADRVVATIERMRMLLRNVETEHGPFHLNLSVESALVFLKKELHRSQVQWHSAGLDQPCSVIGDGAQLQIAVVNLVRNAIQAMETTPTDKRHLQVTLIQSVDTVRIAVADSGPGFRADFQEHRDSGVLNTTKADGMGVGLYVVQTAVANHQGRLHFQRSMELGGAEVVIELPRFSPGASDLPSAAAEGL